MAFEYKRFVFASFVLISNCFSVRCFCAWQSSRSQAMKNVKANQNRIEPIALEPEGVTKRGETTRKKKIHTHTHTIFHGEDKAVHSILKWWGDSKSNSLFLNHFCFRSVSNWYILDSNDCSKPMHLSKTNFILSFVFGVRIRGKKTMNYE